MTNLSKEVSDLLSKLSPEEKDTLRTEIWFLKEDCLGEVSYIVHSIELTDLYNKLKEKYK